MAIRKVNDNYKKRIEDLEYSLNKSKKKETLFDEIQRKIAESESERKIAQAKLQQEITNVTSMVTIIQEKDIMVQEELTQHTKQLEFQMTEFSRLSEHFSEYKTVVAEQIAAVARDVSESFNSLKVKDMDRDNNITLNSTLLNSHTEALKDYQEQIQQHSFKVQTLHEELAELRAAKLEVQKYMDDFAMIKRELTGNRYSCDDISSRIKETDNYLDKYLPIKIQTMIGETLHKIQLPYQEELKLCSHQEEKFAELREIVLKDNGLPSLKKKEYHIPEIVVPQRPASSKRNSSLSKKLSRRNMGQSASSTVKEGSSQPRKTLTRSRQSSIKDAGLPDILTKENQGIHSNDSQGTLGEAGSLPSPRTGQSVDYSTGGSVEQSRMSRGSKGGGKPIKIEENKSSLYKQSLQHDEAEMIDSVVIEEEARNLQQASGATSQESKEQDGTTQEEENLQEVPSENEEDSEEKLGMMVSEGFIDDMLLRAQKQTKAMIDAAIEKMTAERDYDFKLDVLTKKIQQGLQGQRSEMQEDFETREKKLRSQVDELSYYCKTLQTDIEEEVKRRKRDKSDLMIEMADLQKELTSDSKDIEEIKTYIKGVAELTNVLAEICQIECSLEAQDQEDRKSVALMGLKDHPGLNAQAQAPQSAPTQPFSTVSSAERVQTAIPMARREDDGTASKELPSIKQAAHVRALSNVEPPVPMSPTSVADQSQPTMPPVPPPIFSPRVPKKPVVNMDRQALLASGSTTLMQQMYKMACLAYLPTKVNYRGGIYSRQQLIHLRGKMLQVAKKSVQRHQFNWSQQKQGKSLFDEVLREEGGNEVGGASLRGDSPSGYDIYNTKMTPETSPSNAKFDALSLSQTAPGGIDGYLAHAVARRSSGLRQSMQSNRTHITTPKDRGNLIGEMSLRRLKAQMKTRAERKSQPDDPRSYRSGFDSDIIQQSNMNPLSVEFMRLNQSFQAMSPNSVRMPVATKNRFQGLDKRPASKQSSNAGGGGYFPQSQLDPKYEGARAVTAASIPKKNL